ncbi:Asp23/Gls24 family envelope stress response protein [Bailinhaonella thermotolerans]|uniref:Asp23/Gls24 family envelope stress response protein n=1 Tax=Bailinhaonella thermotolerans TaxID=1070861 RepID=A0A3A4BPW4_9ACTN|nr:Asp23/Gls24 family envelope stress response protein [Bailinhaonella thermotolerans]RJL33186.1 Asp23/Gls24 family envelope stress response protein [Bailinhaonella thermotolerans]
MTLPPEERGRTRVGENVVARVAARAATEVDHASGLDQRVIRLGSGHDRDAKAAASVTGDVAVLRLHIAVDYPSPVCQVADAVRRHVTRRVHGLTGLRVEHVDVDVDRFTREQS